MAQAAATAASGLGPNPSTRLEVWAPRAHQVEVLLADASPALMQPALMQPDPYRPGWWVSNQLYHGRYAFLVDGERHPDPRSPDQPDGPDGWSHTLEHGSYGWQDQSWHGRPLASCVLYELHVGTFSPAGTYAGVQERLDHLCALGVGAIELLPLNSFPGRWGWGYDGVAWFAPHHHYGRPAELKALVDACHQRGLAVIGDVVYNHVGPAGNHLWAFGPYFTEGHHTPWGKALNVDGPDSDEVRRFVIDNALMWLGDYHFDGLRLDAVHAIVDHSALHLLEELAEAVERLALAQDRRLWLIAESDANDPRLVRSRQAHGFGLDGQWSDDLHHGLHVALSGQRDGYYADFEGLADVAKALTDVFVRDGVYSPSLRRRHGRPVTNLAAGNFITALQNHDQIGNRVGGERIAMIAGAARQRIGAALALLAPTVPLLFQGEEWAASTPFRYFADHHDPALAAAISEGRRREFAAFGWTPEAVADPQDPATFAASVLRWEEVAQPDHAAMLAWYRDLLALRRRFALAGAKVEVVMVNNHALLVRLGPIWLALNLAAAPCEFRLEPSPGRALRPLHLAIASGAVELRHIDLRLGPDAVAVCVPGEADHPGPVSAGPDPRDNVTTKEPDEPLAR